MPTTVAYAICSAARWGAMPAPEQALYSGYYTTITAWESACPANLVSVDQIWEGHLYPDGGGTDGEWILSALLTIATTTVDATRFMRLRAAAGHAFYDHANKLTNALRYNTANGVAVRANYGYGTGAIRQGERSQLVGLQVSYERSALYNDSGANWLTDRCILSGGQSNQHIVRIAAGTNAIVSNSLIISRGDRDGVYTVGAGATFKNCTFIKPTGVAASAISSGGYGGVSTFQNCAIFGFNAPTTGFSGSSSYNGTNLSSIGGSNNQVSQTFADQFENISSVAALDARLKSTNTIEGDGSAALLYGAYDILGQGWNTTPSLGAFEGDVAAGGAYTLTCEHGTYTLSGQTATLSRNRALVAEHGTYTLTGQTADVTHTGLANNYTITALHGDYTVSGQTATLTRSRVITAEHGNYDILGQSVEISKGRTLTAEHGLYALAGQTADITYTPLATGYTITALHGDYTLNGQSADLRKSHLLSALHGEYVVSGQTATITSGAVATVKPRLINAKARTLTIDARARTLTIEATP